MSSLDRPFLLKVGHESAQGTTFSSFQESGYSSEAVAEFRLYTRSSARTGSPLGVSCKSLVTFTSFEEKQTCTRNVTDPGGNFEDSGTIEYIDEPSFTIQNLGMEPTRSVTPRQSIIFIIRFICMLSLVQSIKWVVSVTEEQSRF